MKQEQNGNLKIDKLVGTDKRENNRKIRENLHLDSNDMMSIKTTFSFIMNLLRTDNIEIDRSEDEQKLIDLLKEKLSYSKEAAINFIKFDEDFKDLNEKTFKFNEKEIEQICKELEKYEKLEDINVQNILEVDDNFPKDDKALKEIITEMSQTEEQKQTNVEVETQTETVKIHRNTNRK